MFFDSFPNLIWTWPPFNIVKFFIHSIKVYNDWYPFIIKCFIINIINNFWLVLSNSVSSSGLPLFILSLSSHFTACCYRFVPCFLGLNFFGCTFCTILESAMVGINLLNCSRLLIIRIEMFISLCTSYRCLGEHGLSEKMSTLEAEKIYKVLTIHLYRIFSNENWAQQLVRAS